MTGLVRFPRSRLASKSFVKFSMCSYERVGWLGSRDVGFSNRDLGKRAEHFAILSILAARMALSCFACCVFHIISIPFNCSDTALRVAKSMVGAKVINIVFSHVCFVFRISRRHSSLGSLAFFNLGNRAEISHMNSRQNWSW